ncbi:MAG: hypothetical protein GYA52_10305, partial [Chloroflexi bacterium]|nr:hypothetical protein [Chloroflexota bacterium]
MVTRILMLGICFVAAFLSSGCSQVPQQRPQDFAIYSYWNTGALPPEYYYEIEIEIDPDRNGTLTYQADYESESGKENVFQFSVDETTWNDFYMWLKTNRIFRNNWQQSKEIMVGGSGTQVKLQMNGEKYEIPSEAVL